MDAKRWAVGLAAVGVLMGGVVEAQTSAVPPPGMVHTETIVAEQRTSVSVRISQEAAQAFLPAGWTAAAAPTLTLIFMDRKLQLDPAGKPLQSGVNQLLVLSLAGRSPAGENRGLIVGGISTDPLGVPGAYKVYGHGQVTVARAETSAVKDGKIGFVVSESWRVLAADGSTLEFDVAFTRGLPNSAAFEQKVYSGADPDFYRIYRGAQASDAVKTATADRVSAVRLSAKGGKLGRAIDGTQVVVGVTNAPVYSRQTFVVGK